MSGTREHYENVIRENAPSLLNYFRRRLDPADAGEAFGEVLLIAWRKRHRMPSDTESARMWLYGVARNVVRSSRRTLARRSAAVQRLSDELRIQSTVESTTLGLEIRSALDTLRPDDAELIRLVYWDGLKSHEAATLLRINASTARSHLSTARARIREYLEANEYPTTSTPEGTALHH